MSAMDLPQSIVSGLAIPIQFEQFNSAQFQFQQLGHARRQLFANAAIAASRVAA
jgi:hypothetical protein